MMQWPGTVPLRVLVVRRVRKARRSELENHLRVDAERASAAPACFPIGLRSIADVDPPRVPARSRMIAADLVAVAVRVGVAVIVVGPEAEAAPETMMDPA